MVLFSAFDDLDSFLPAAVVKQQGLNALVYGRTGYGSGSASFWGLAVFRVKPVEAVEKQANTEIKQVSLGWRFHLNKP